MVDICNRIYEDPSITNKGNAWSDQAHNPKFYGVAFTNDTRRGAPLGPWTRPLRSRYARLDTSEVGEAGAPRKILDSDTLKT